MKRPRPPPTVIISTRQRVYMVMERDVAKGKASTPHPARRNQAISASGAAPKLHQRSTRTPRRPHSTRRQAQRVPPANGWTAGLKTTATLDNLYGSTWVKTQPDHLVQLHSVQLERFTAHLVLFDSKHSTLFVTTQFETWQTHLVKSFGTTWLEVQRLIQYISTWGTVTHWNTAACSVSRPCNSLDPSGLTTQRDSALPGWVNRNTTVRQFTQVRQGYRLYRAVHVQNHFLEWESCSTEEKRTVTGSTIEST